MAEHVWLRGFVDRQADTDDDTLRFVAATEGEKADGLNLQMDRVRLDRWRANPVVLYGHEYAGREALPIGRAEETFVDGGRLLADVVFDPGDDFAAEVERKYRQGFLSAVSVGFETGEIDGGGVPEWWEMLELSAVPVGLDPQALVESGRALARHLEDAGEQQTCPRCGPAQGSDGRGGDLAGLLNGRISEMTDGDLFRSDVVSRMARAASVSESTVNRYLCAETDCPPRERLEGFASALDVSASSVLDAAERDGCEYERQPKLHAARRRLLRSKL